MLETDRRLRKLFYLESVVENYQNVCFSGDVAANIRNAQNHLNYSSIDKTKITGHINWYSRLDLAQQYKGNACVVIYSNENIDTSSWNILPSVSKKLKNKYRFIFSGNFPYNEKGTEDAAQWTKKVFEEISKHFCKD